MNGRRPLLNEQTTAKVVEAIEGGAFDWVAAEAAGIGRRTFYDWLARGERGDRRYIEFLVRVRRARAEARVSAESLVRQRDPLSWLRLGPGRERDDGPGWTAPQKPQPQSSDQDEPRRTFRDVLDDVVKHELGAGDGTPLDGER
jgi:hypothetical protein